MAETPIDPDLYSATVDAIAEAQERIDALLDEGRPMPKGHKVGSISSCASGLPKIDTPLSDNYVDYSHVFGLQGGGYYPVGYDELPKLQVLFEVARSIPRIREHTFLDNPKMRDERFFQIDIANLAHDTLDRLLHTVGRDYSADDLLNTYCELERGLLWEKAPVELYVPLAITKVSSNDVVPLGPNVRIERMTDDLSLARMPEYEYAMTAHPRVLQAARHAIVISNLVLDNQSRYVLFTQNEEFYPRERIEQALEALRAAAGVDTGYAQIFMRPLGWAWDFRAHLPPVVTGASTRRYPDIFDRQWWDREDLAIIEPAQLDTAASIFQALETKPRRLGLAASRLSAAMLREDEADSILDLCIGLEALLGDESPGDTTYKLGLRTAAVMALAEDPSDPAVAVRDIKRIYSYRSAIAHGREPGKTKTLTTGQSSRPTVDAAREYLASAIRLLASQPELAEDPQALDQTLILSRLKAASKRT